LEDAILTILLFADAEKTNRYDWLRSHSPMLCRWELKTMEFQENWQSVPLQCMKQDQISLTALSPEQLVKWHQGNDIWALAMIKNIIDQDAQDLYNNGIPARVAELLRKIQDVLSDPQELPHAGIMTIQYICFPTLHQITLIPIVTLLCTKTKLSVR
jgi:hypothetical protein